MLRLAAPPQGRFEPDAGACRACCAARNGHGAGSPRGSGRRQTRCGRYGKTLRNRKPQRRTQNHSREKRRRRCRSHSKSPHTGSRRARALVGASAHSCVQGPMGTVSELRQIPDWSHTHGRRPPPRFQLAYGCEVNRPAPSVSAHADCHEAAKRCGAADRGLSVQRRPVDPKPPDIESLAAQKKSKLPRSMSL